MNENSCHLDPPVFRRVSIDQKLCTSGFFTTLGHPLRADGRAGFQPRPSKLVVSNED